MDIGQNGRTGNTYTWLNSTTAGGTVWGNLTLQTGGGNVGIGTTNPYTQLTNNGLNNLDASGAGHGPNAFAWNQNSVGYVETLYNLNSSSTGNGLLIKGAGNTTNSLLSVDYGTAEGSPGSAIFRVLGNGNVGVGTLTPGALLDVYGTGVASAIIVPRDIAANRPAGANGMIRYNTTNNAFEFFQNSAWVSYGTGSGNSSFPLLASPQTSAPGSPSYSFAGNTNTGIFSPVVNQVAISTAGTTALTILANGNVGIGTSSPGFPIDIYSNGTSATPIAVLENPNTSASATADLRFRVGNLGYDTGALSNGYMAGTGFSLALGAGTPSAEIMRLVQGGRVGIGTTIPLATLDVAGVVNTSINGALSFNSYYNGGWKYNATGGAGFIQTDSTSGTMKFFTAPSGTAGSAEVAVNSLNLTATGNAGVGTTTPAATLHAVANTTIGTGLSGALIAGNASIPNKRIYLGYDSSADVGVIQSDTYGSSSSNLVLNPSGGNIGIGTSSPTQKLDVNSPYGGRIRLADITGGPAGALNIIETIGSRVDANTTFSGRYGAAFWRSDSNFITSGQELGTYAFGGQYTNTVGFNNSNLLYSASMVGLADGVFSSASSMPTALSFRTGSQGYAYNSPNLAYGTERMRLTSSGRVGIGTSLPGAALEIYAIGTAASAMIVPRDTTTNRPTGVNGMIRYNTNLGALETFSNGTWQTISAGTSSGTLQSITTSTGLLGGTITTNGTIAVNAGTGTGQVVLEQAGGQILQSSGTGSAPAYSFVNSPTSGLASPGSNQLSLITNGTPAVTINSSNYVGIGTTNPTAPLVVASGSSAMSVTPGWFGGSGTWINLDTQGPSGIGTGGAGANAWVAYVAAVGNWFGNAVVGDIVYRNSTGRLLFGTSAGTSSMIITNSGVGIGTTIPTSTLSVGNINSGYFLNAASSLSVGNLGTLGTTAGSYSYPSELQTGTGTSGNTLRLQTAPYRRVAGTDWYGAGFRMQYAVDNSFTAGGLSYLELSGADPLNVGGGLLVLGVGQDVLTVNSAGNVGIGTTAPTALLDVSGTGSFSAIRVPQDTTAARPSGANGMIRYNTNTNSLEAFANGSWSSLSTSASESSSYLALSGGTMSGAIVHPNGLVNAPSMSFADVTTGFYSTGPGNIIASTAGTARLTISPTGSVGVGTTSPGATFEVNGNARIWGNAPLRLGEASNTYYYDMGRVAATGGFLINGNQSGSVSYDFQKGGSSLLTIANSGNIGIGVTTPSYPLDLVRISGSTPTAAMLDIVQSSTNGANTDSNALIRFTESNGVNGRTWFTGTGSNSYFGHPDNFGFYDFSAGAARMVFNTSGNVGIGTTAPTAALHLYGTTALQGVIQNSGDSGATKLAFVNAAGKTNIGRAVTVGGVSGSAFEVADGSTSRLFIAQSGNIGIGTTSPTGALQIGTSGNQAVLSPAGAINAGSAFAINMQGTPDNSGGYTAKIIQARDSAFNYGSFLSFSTEAKTAANFTDTSTEKMRITATGNVGIGTSGPLYQTHILGAGQTTSNLIDSGANGGSIYLQDSGAVSGNGGAVVFGAAQGKFAAIKSFITDGTSNVIGDLTFSTRNSTSDTSLTERMRIQNTGRVGIGTSNPSSLLHLYGGGNYSGGIKSQYSGSPGTDWAMVMGTDNTFYFGYGTSSNEVSVAQISTSGAYAQISDGRLKKDIHPIEDAMEKIVHLRGVSYRWIEEKFRGDQTEFGVIAQEVEKIIPEIVATDREGKKQVRYSMLIPVIINALKETYHKLTAVDERVLRLEAANRTFEEKNSQLASDIKKLEKDNSALKNQNEVIQSYLCSKDPDAVLCEKLGLNRKERGDLYQSE